MTLLTMDEVVAGDVPPLEGADPLPAEALFEGGPRDEASFGGVLGLREGPMFTPQERRRIQELIQAHMVETAKEFSPAAAAEVAAVDLELYHEISDKLDHRRLLSKRGRIMSAEAVAEMKTMSFFDYAKKAFGGDVYLSDEESVGHEQVCLRIVRPERREDVGTLHADAWFWEHYKWPTPPGEHRAKMWLGVCVDPERNGLLLAPGSHRTPAPYRVVIEDERLSFSPDFDVEGLDLRRFRGAPGAPIMFNYRTLHVGSLNRAPHTRVSIEITLMYKGAEQR